MQAQRASSFLRAARVMVMEGWREAIRIGFEYYTLGVGGYPPLLSKVCKVSDPETLSLDFCLASCAAGWWDGLSEGCVCQAWRLELGKRISPLRSK